MSMPMAERYKVKVSGRSRAGVSGSNPAGDKDVSVVCCKGKGTSQDNQDKRNKWGKSTEREQEKEFREKQNGCLSLVSVVPITRPEEFYRLCCVIARMYSRNLKNEAAVVGLGVLRQGGKEDEGEEVVCHSAGYFL
jgi:hypothetical protein